MAFDGTTTYKVTEELEERITGGKIDRIYQTEKDEVVLQIRRGRDVSRLLMSAHAESARFYLTEQKPETPLEPPMFCMLFRKHFNSGRILGCRQIGFDRILEIVVQGYSDLGDPCEKRIILEIMGRHSNLILVDENGRIIDSVHHVGQSMSSFRTVLPGLPYETPSHNHRLDPRETVEQADFDTAWDGRTGTVRKSMFQIWNGISPFTTAEICFAAGIDGNKRYADLTEGERNSLFAAFYQYFHETLRLRPDPRIFANREYSMVESRMMADSEYQGFGSPSELLDAYYVREDNKNRLKQKAQDLRHLVISNLDRAERKEELQNRQMAETKEREPYRRAGDLILANIYRIKQGDTLLETEDFYQDPPVMTEIALDPNLTPSQNAQRNYKKYDKLKRTEEALTGQLKETREEVAYLRSILNAMELADCEKDIEDIRSELAQTGYLKHTAGRNKKKNLQASHPLVFETSEKLRVLVGKNNMQNDLLTFKMASPYDIWLHVKNVPGSHTILFCGDRKLGLDYTEKSIIEAARIAAAHSSVSEDSRVAVDYTERRYVKKPSGSKPGFVIYTHQKTLVVEPLHF